MTTLGQSISYSMINPGEPVLPRKALLEVLDDRCETVQFISVNPYTFVAVRSWYDGIEFFGYGFSKVCWPDMWDAETGAEIAHRRALISILHQVRDRERDNYIPF